MHGIHWISKLVAAVKVTHAFSPYITSMKALTRTLREICEHTGFHRTLFSRIKTEPMVLSLYENTKTRLQKSVFSHILPTGVFL